MQKMHVTAPHASHGETIEKIGGASRQKGSRRQWRAERVARAASDALFCRGEYLGPKFSERHLTTGWSLSNMNSNGVP